MARSVTRAMADLRWMGRRRLRADVVRPRAGRPVAPSRRLLPPAVHPARARAGRLVPEQAAARGLSSRPTTSATWSRGGRAGGSGPGRPDRLAPRLGARRRGVRRAAGRGLGAGGDRRAAVARAFVPARPIGVSVFVEEEGSRFGLACLGSRLATGAVDVGAGAGAAGPRRRGAARTVVEGGGPGLLDGVGTLRGAARRAGPRPGRPRRGGRGGQRDLAARALPLRLHRRGQPRGLDPDGGPGATRC